MTANTARKRNDQQITLRLPAFLRDGRVLSAIAQLIFLILFTGLLAYIIISIYNSLVALNITPSFDFRTQRAGFQLSEAPAWYTPEATYQQAYLVGIINTLKIVIPGLVLSTVLGVLIGIALLSRNFMVRATSASYVEVLRNTPLLVQLFFWYFVVMFSLPAQDVTLPSEAVFILQLRMLAYPVLWLSLIGISWRRRLPQNTFVGSLLGFALMEIALRLTAYSDASVLLLGALGLVLVFLAATKRLPGNARGYALGIGLAAASQLVGLLVVLGLIAARVLPADATFWEIFPAVFITRKGFAFPELRLDSGLQVILPVKPRFQFTSGTLISPEYMALFLGLVIYTSAFIGEIVRAGIQAVPYGQIEASRAIGLTQWQTLRLIVLPQALRVILPPLSSQYLNLAKNSTLAVAVAFSDAYSVGQTVMNQSGQSVPVFLVILMTYLVMSLIIATFMNVVNTRFQLVTR